MTFKKIMSFTLVLIIILLIITSCSTVEVYHKPGNRIGHGPPAHARAHGYRRKQIAGVELVYDSSLGVYIVIGHPNHYYHDGYFYRLHGTMWEMSLHPDEGWKYVSEKSVPVGLKAKGKGKYKRAS